MSRRPSPRRALVLVLTIVPALLVAGTSARAALRSSPLYYTAGEAAVILCALVVLLVTFTVADR